MKITELKIYPSNHEKVAAYASLVFDGSFAVKHIRIVRTDKGLIVSMPNREKQNNYGETFYEDVAFPVNTRFRQYLNKEILQAYDNTEKLRTELQCKQNFEEASWKR